MFPRPCSILIESKLFKHAVPETLVILPYSHYASLLGKMQKNDQILWDKLNMPVSVLKYSIYLKGPKVPTIPVCDHFLTSTRRVHTSSSVLLPDWGLSQSYHFSKLKLWNGVFKKKMTSPIWRKIHLRRWRWFFFLPSPPLGMSWKTAQGGQVMVIGSIFLSKWNVLKSEPWTKSQLIFILALLGTRHAPVAWPLASPSVLLLWTAKWRRWQVLLEPVNLTGMPGSNMRKTLCSAILIADTMGKGKLSKTVENPVVFYWWKDLTCKHSKVLFRYQHPSPWWNTFLSVFLLV